MSCCGGAEPPPSNADTLQVTPSSADTGHSAAAASNQRKDKEKLIKLLMLGDSGVGKTSLLLRYAEDHYSDTFITTIGIDFKSKTVDIDGQIVKLQLWDTAGQERFRTITSAYYRGAHGILLAYDVTDANSFSNIKNWARNIEQHASSSVNKVLIATKSDLSAKRVISYEQGKKLADEFGIKFFETSAKQSTGVDEPFLSIAREVLTRLDG